MRVMRKQPTPHWVRSPIAGNAFKKLAKSLMKSAAAFLAITSQYKAITRYCERIASLCFL